ATEVELHATQRRALVHGGTVIVRPGRKVSLDDFYSHDFVGPSHHGNVIVGSDETTGGVQAEARAKLSLDAETKFQVGDREDGVVEIVNIDYGGDHQLGWLRGHFLCERRG